MSSKKSKRPNRANREQSGGHAEATNRGKNLMPVILLAGFCLAVVASIAISSQSAEENEPVAEAPQTTEQASPAATTSEQTAQPAHSHDDDPLWPDVIEIAGEFYCACDGCEFHALQECECQMENGAYEQKHFIRAELAKGNSKEEVIETVEETYGNRITNNNLPGTGTTF